MFDGVEYQYQDLVNDYHEQTEYQGPRSAELERRWAKLHGTSPICALRHMILQTDCDHMDSAPGHRTHRAATSAQPGKKPGLRLCPRRADNGNKSERLRFCDPGLSLPSLLEHGSHVSLERCVS